MNFGARKFFTNSLKDSFIEGENRNPNPPQTYTNSTIIYFNGLVACPLEGRGGEEFVQGPLDPTSLTSQFMGKQG